MSWPVTRFQINADVSLYPQDIKVHDYWLTCQPKQRPNNLVTQRQPVSQPVLKFFLLMKLLMFERKVDLCPH